MGPPRVLSKREKQRNAAYSRTYRAQKRLDKAWMAKESARRMVSVH
jgi:hypothetical protein